MPATDLELAKIRIDGGTQPRAEINEAAVAEYAEAFELGETLPPLVVFFDGVDHWLADGFHRYHAGCKAHIETLPADIRKGTRREAVLYSVGANASHGLRRTNEDKRKAVETLLNDPEWAQWSAREIARRCGVSHNFVTEVRSEHGQTMSSDDNVSPPAAVGKVKFTTPTGKTAEYPAERAPRKPQFNPDEFEAAAELAPEPINEHLTPVSAPSSPEKPKPDRLPAVCERAQSVSGEIREHGKAIAYIVADLVDIAGKPGGDCLHKSSVEAAGRDLKNALSAALYHAPCPLCSARGCATCGQRGWLTKAQYDRIPAENKPK